MQQAFQCVRIPLSAVVLRAVVLIGALNGFAPATLAEPTSRPQIDHAMQLVAAGQLDKAQQVLRDHLRVNPTDDSAYEALLAVCANRELPAGSTACNVAKQKLSRDFRILQTSRFVLLSDADAAATREHALWVERACAEFERFAANCSLKPLPLQHKLVCVLFEDHEEYRDFARQHDGMNNSAFTGYYSPRHDRVVFSLCDAGARGPGKSADADRAGQRTSGSKPVLGFESAAAGHEHASCDHAERLPKEAAAKCVHETIHQLMFHTGLMSADVQYPLWICEGLSTAFETDSPTEPFGPDRDFAPRRRGFDQMLRRGHVIPLRDLVTLTTVSSCDAQFIREVYHQSYALVTWLCRNRPEQIRHYLQSMLHEPVGKLTTQRHLELFEQSFGSVDAFESIWLQEEMALLRSSSN